VELPIVFWRFQDETVPGNGRKPSRAAMRVPPNSYAGTASCCTTVNGCEFLWSLTYHSCLADGAALKGMPSDQSGTICALNRRMWLNDNTDMKSRDWCRNSSRLTFVPPRLDCDPCVSDSVRRGTICFPAAVPELRTSTSKQFALARLWTRALDFGASCNGLPLFSVRLRLRPAHKPMLPPINPKWSRRVDRRPRNTIENTIELYRSRPNGAWRSQESTPLSHRTGAQPEHRSHRTGLPASTPKEQRLRPARSSIRTN